jgi:hypothetical protein
MFGQENFSDGLTLRHFNGEELMQMLEKWGFVDKDVRTKFFKKLQEEMPNFEIIHPAPPKNEQRLRMSNIARGIYKYEKKMRHFPPSGNENLVKAFKEAQCYEFRPGELNGKGQLVDKWGHPYVYIYPGKFYKSEFDLYSVGPNGVDEGGKSGDDVFCYLGLA